MDDSRVYSLDGLYCRVLQRLMTRHVTSRLHVMTSPELMMEMQPRMITAGEAEKVYTRF